MRGKRYLLYFIFVILLFNFASAENWGYNYLEEPRINNQTININNTYISGNSTFNQSLTDTLYISKSEESNHNVNSSTYWANLSNINQTQFENSNGFLHAIQSWWDNIFVNIDGDTMTGRLNISISNDGSLYPALNIVNSNDDMSAIWVTGNETDTGTIKVSHIGYDGDGVSSALSLDLLGDTTQSQGIFLKTGNSSGQAFQITNGTTTHFQINASSGRTVITTDDNEAFLVQKVDGTDVFKVSPTSGLVWTKKLIPTSTDSFDIGDSSKKYRDLTLSGNITLGQKITFAFGEIIDNIVDGWIRITGNLNVTGNISTDEYFLGDASDVTIGYNSETLKQLFDDTLNSGILDAIEVKEVSGLDINWTSGEIYDKATNQIINVDNGTATLTDDKLNYLIWQSGSILTVSLTEATGDEISIAHVNTQNGEIYTIHEESIINERERNVVRGLADVFPIIVSGGVLISEDTDATLEFDVELSAGTYYHDMHNEHTISSIVYSRLSNVTIWYKDSSGDYIKLAEQKEMNYTTWSDSGVLTDRAINKYYGDMFFVVNDEIHQVLAGTESDTVAQAVDNANNAIVPTGLENSPRSVCVVLRGSDTSLPASTSDQWIDLRPIIGGTVGAGTITDHGNLIGLGDDDHTQYLLASGLRALTDNWNVGSFNISADWFKGNGAEINGNVNISGNFTINNSVLFVDTMTGNVGVKNLNPKYSIDVNGGTRVTGTDTVTVGSGLEQHFVGGIGYLFPFDRSGSTYLPLSIRGTIISFDVGNVVIGAGTDSAQTGNTNLLVTKAGTTNLAIRDSTNNVELLNYAYSGGGLIGTATNHALSIRTNNLNRITILNDGKVGIGVTPTKQLQLGETDKTVIKMSTSGTASASTIGRVNNVATFIGDDMDWEGTTWVARDIAASMIYQSIGAINFYTASGLTAGNTFSPVKRAAIDNNGLNIVTGGELKHNGITTNGYITTGDTGFASDSAIRLKVIDLDDWNMDTTTTLNKAHGLTYAKIVNVWVVIKSDTDSSRYSLLSSSPAGSSNFAEISWGATNVVSKRETGGNFDNVNFDSTSYNRGWIYIQYID